MKHISWPAFWAWVGVGIFGLAILVREELGITHVWGLDPITEVAAGDIRMHHWLLFAAIFAAGISFSAWWAVHIYRRVWGDLSKKKNWLIKHAPIPGTP